MIDAAALHAAMKTVMEARALNRSIGFTNGCFDLLHYGHVKFLEACAERCDCLIVGINDDEWIREHKGPRRPIVPLEQREYMLEALTVVDAVVAFDSEQALSRLVDVVQPDWMFKGAEYERRLVTGSGKLEAYGGQLLFIPMVDAISTTDIEAKIINAHLPAQVDRPRVPRLD